MTSSPLDRLQSALDATGQVVAGVTVDQWSAGTPCPEWSVQALLNHVVVGNQLFALLLRGETPDVLALRDADLLGDDPGASYGASSVELVAAFSQPGASERIIEPPFGTVPGAVALHLRVVEAVVHGWDLATATGQTLSVDDDLVELELAFTQQMLTAMPPGRRPFGPSQPVNDAAPVLDRLVACLGRTVAS